MKSTGSVKGRQPWKLQNVAREYHRSTGYAAYTMVFNAALETEMMDGSLAKEWRVLAAIKRFSWGRWCDWAVDGIQQGATDPKPRPLTQEAIARILSLSPASVSEACTFLKGQGYLRTDHLYLFPEKKANPLESVKDSGVSSDSSNLSSPYLRFKSSYLSENKELSKIITQISDERNKLQDAARQLSIEMRKHERYILAAFRDWEREHPEEQTQKNQQNKADTQTDPNLQRLCAPAQNGNVDNGETKANCTSPHVSESDSNSKMEYFATPAAAPPESESYSAKNPNENGTARPSSLKPLKSEYINPKGTTTTESEPAPASSSSPISGMVPQEWRDGLACIFTRARKPAPLPAQSTGAYFQLDNNWKEFLEWLPGAPQFKRTHHPGGLPTLIQFFDADRQPAPAPAEPESMTKEELAQYWRERFEQNPVERKDIERMYPELFNSEVV